MTECREKLASTLRDHLTEEEHRVFVDELDAASKWAQQGGATIADLSKITALYRSIQSKLQRYITRQREFKRQPDVIFLMVNALKVSQKIISYISFHRSFIQLINRQQSALLNS